MYYLEVKIEKEIKNVSDASDFTSHVICSHESLGQNENTHYFQKEKLLNLEFIYNETTNGYSLEKELSIEELKKLTRKINELKNHKLIHGYTELVLYNDELYFWDKALIYEGIDTFEYCLKHHNLLQLDNLNVLTKSNTISDELLSFTKYTKRYCTPNLEFITQNCLWDKQDAYKIAKQFVLNKDEYILKHHAQEY